MTAQLPMFRPAFSPPAVFVPPSKLVEKQEEDAPKIAAIAFTIRVKTKNPLNGSRGNSMVAAIMRSKEDADQRAKAVTATRAALLHFGFRGPDFVPCDVTMTRYSTSKMDDEGAIASCKRLRDGIAEAIGVDDGSPVISFKVEQAKGKQREYRVDVRIQRRKL